MAAVKKKFVYAYDGAERKNHQREITFNGSFLIDDREASPEAVLEDIVQILSDYSAQILELEAQEV